MFYLFNHFEIAGQTIDVDAIPIRICKILQNIVDNDCVFNGTVNCSLCQDVVIFLRLYCHLNTAYPTICSRFIYKKILNNYIMNLIFNWQCNKKHNTTNLCFIFLVKMPNEEAFIDANQDFEVTDEIITDTTEANVVFQEDETYGNYIYILNKNLYT